MLSERGRTVVVLKTYARQLRLLMMLKKLIIWFQGLSMNNQLKHRPHMWREAIELADKAEVEIRRGPTSAELAGIDDDRKNVPEV